MRSTLPYLRVEAANLLISIRAERAKLERNLKGLRNYAARTVETTRSLENQFTEVPREADTQDAARRLKTLSRRQREILKKVIDGLPNKTIAFDLGLGEKTVETHRARLMRKLGVDSLPDLVRIVLRARGNFTSGRPTAGSPRATPV